MDEAKRELVRDWLQKAAHDLFAARLLARNRPAIPDVAAYHCQQAAEKALKGFLAYHDERPDRTHDLGLLIAKVARIEPGFNSWLDAADRLTPLATAYRYPSWIGMPEPDELEEALEDARTIVEQVLAFLPSKVHPDPIEES